MAYRACLVEVDHTNRFYHASFALDPINVSRTLLEWRAILYEYGWDGTFAEGASARLRDLRDVERLAASRVPLNRGQRVQRILAALDDTRAPRSNRSNCWTTAHALPAAWRALLDRLNYVVCPGATPTPQASTGTDLRIVQRVLADIAADTDVRAVTKHTLRGDGTFVVLRAASRDITAQAIAECVRNAHAPNEALVIAERDGVILDNALERVGLPRAGFQHYSRFRAVSQLLKLALSLIWRPVSPHLLLQFLIHPIGPLPRHVRDALASAVAEQPGIGGGKWREALARAQTRMRDEFGADEKAVAKLQSTIADWLEGERFDPAAGAPIAALAHRTQLCSTLPRDSTERACR